MRELVLHDDLGDLPRRSLREPEAQRVREHLEPGRLHPLDHLALDLADDTDLPPLHAHSVSHRPARDDLAAYPLQIAFTMRALVPIGRVLFALIFVASMVGHVSSAEISEAAAHGVPLVPVAVPLAGIIALVGGLSIMLGYRARFGALLLVVFLVPVTLIMHRFWGLPDPQLAMMQRIHFLKNLSLVGTSLLIMYFGSGPYSLDS